ncbi:MAG TPA: sugar ABC transporter permease [Methylomirabilota bacterium]|nr:sugar ABC transporter permease [Methylomirabilota bacterium]HEV8673966.1 sugar ABC transporter permease [Methylomirabilota bacterium]
MRRSRRPIVARLRARHLFHAYLFVAPVLLLFGVFRVVPAVQTLLYSVYKVELVRGRFTFLGLENFQALLADPGFRKAAVNTLVYVAAIVPISAALGLGLAVLFNTRFRLRELFKAIYFAPMVTSTAAAAMVWWWLYNPQFGLFNVLLRLVGIPDQPWLMSSRTALVSIIIFSIWKSLGYNMIIYLAGLQAIPAQFYEAATIDGAGAPARFWRISVPLLAPTTTFLLIYNSILAFQVFDQVFVLTGGGPAGATNVVVLEVYRQAFERYNFGYAAAEATVLFVLILGVTVLQYVYSRRFEVTY